MGKPEKRGGKTKPRPARQKQRAKNATVLLAKPLEKFNYEPPLTHPTWEEWETDRASCSVTYSPGEMMMTGNDRMTWMRVEAVEHDSEDLAGYILIPWRYYGLWRRLIWGAKWYEGMWKVWEQDAKEINARDPSTYSRVDKWILVARRSAAIKTVWYTAIRRIILEELLDIDTDDWSDEDPEANPVLNMFIEFGIRDYRSWLFDSFDNVKKGEQKYLKLDPTAPENEETFRTLSLVINPRGLTSFTVHGYTADFLKMPPEDDDWLDGPVPLPEPDDEFKANILRYAPSAAVEAIPLADEEGDAHMPIGVLIWECQEPEVPFRSRNYLVYFLAHGGSGLPIVITSG
jgi:hypothetical protein